VAPSDSVLHPPGSPYGPGSGQAAVTFMADDNVMDVRDGTLYANVTKFRRQPGHDQATRS
jgi:hypothetical protein